MKYYKKNLSTSICLFFGFIAAQAQTFSYDLDSLVLTDNRISVSFAEADRSLLIITKEQIKNLPVNSIEEVLAQQAGIDIRQRGVGGVQADVSLRGGSFEQVLILVNGVRMSDLQTGHHSLNIPVNLKAVERIEIVKGPSARRFGQNAYTGAVNIITKVTTDPSLEIAFNAGDFGVWSANVNGQTGGDNFKQFINGSYTRTDGYRHNTDSKRTDFWYQNEMKFGRHSFGFQGGIVEKKFGANGFYATPSATEQYEEIQSSLVNFMGKLNFENLEIKPSVYWRRHQDMYVFVRNNPSIYRNMHIGNTLGAILNGSYKSSLGITGLGVEVRKEFLGSNKLGHWDRNSLSVFAEHLFRLFDNKLNVTPGVMVANYNDFGTFFYPGIDVGYSINSNHNLFANIGKTYRTPTYTDLYYEDSVNEGNPDLKPEQAVSYEIGYKFTPDNFYFNLTLFRRDNKDLIDWLKKVETDKWKPFNLAKVNTQGIEVFAGYNFQDIFLNNFSVGYTYLDNEIEVSPDILSRYVLDNLKHQFTAKFNHDLFRNISAEWSYRYNYRLALDDYHLLDAKVRWNNEKFEIFIQGNNLLNTNYTETNLIPMPRRWFNTGVNFKIL